MIRCLNVQNKLEREKKLEISHSQGGIYNESTTNSRRTRTTISSIYLGFNYYFESDEAFEQAFKSVENKIGEEQRYQGHLGDNAQTLYEALAFEDELGSQLEKYMFMPI